MMSRYLSENRLSRIFKEYEYTSLHQGLLLINRYDRCLCMKIKKQSFEDGLIRTDKYQKVKYKTHEKLMEITNMRYENLKGFTWHNYQPCAFYDFTKHGEGRRVEMQGIIWTENK